MLRNAGPLHFLHTCRSLPHEHRATDNLVFIHAKVRAVATPNNGEL
jgi:hypothetical protein